MKKNILKSTLVTMAIISSMVMFTGCNRKLEVKFDTKASDYVKLGEYKGINISMDEEAIINSSVDKRVQSDLETVTEYSLVNRRAQEEDQVAISFSGTIGGQSVEGFSSNDYSIVLGKDVFIIPGFVEELYGMSAGEVKVITLTIPTTFTDAPEYAGKRIVYTINVSAVKGPVVPQITDAYAKKYFSFNTVAEYRENLKSIMKDSIDEKLYEKKLEVSMMKLQENCEVIGYPEEALKKKIEQISASMKFYATNYNTTIEQYCLDRYKVTFDEFCKKSLVQDLILQEIIVKEKLSVDEYYYKGTLTEFAKDNGYTEPESFVKKYGKEYIVKNMLVQKAIDFVMDNAVVSK